MSGCGWDGRGSFGGQPRLGWEIKRKTVVPGPECGDTPILANLKNHLQGFKAMPVLTLGRMSCLGTRSLKMLLGCSEGKPKGLPSPMYSSDKPLTHLGALGESRSMARQWGYIHLETNDFLSPASSAVLKFLWGGSFP